MLSRRLCSNSLAMKITSNTEFDSVWIQPAAGDAGGALDAALAVSVQQNNEERELYEFTSIRSKILK